jgi:hypothetical protein
MRAMIRVVTEQKKEVIRLRNEGEEGRRIAKQRERIAELQALVAAEEKTLADMLGRIANADALMAGYDTRLQELQDALVMVQQRELIERIKRTQQMMAELGMGNPSAVTEDQIS